jgi:site-specific recombinase XerD
MTVAVSHKSTTPGTLVTRDSEAPDERIVAMWLHGRSAHTKRAYARAIASFAAFTRRKALRHVTLSDLQAFADSLDGKPASIAQTLNAVKSLLSFAARIGAVPFNVGAALRTPKGRGALADRILSEAEVQRMLALSEGRDHALVRLAYAGGLRVSELVSLRWRDVADVEDGTMFVTVFGKGEKPRTVRVSRATGDVLRALRGDADRDAFIFPGRKGALDASQAWRIIRDVAKRAKVRKGHVSPHFLRHAHASHAIDRGVKITTVRDTLGHSSIAVTDRYSHARPGDSSGLALAV